jgi:hypothetical protein
VPYKTTRIREYFRNMPKTSFFFILHFSVFTRPGLQGASPGRPPPMAGRRASPGRHALSISSSAWGLASPSLSAPAWPVCSSSRQRLAPHRHGSARAPVVLASACSRHHCPRQQQATTQLAAAYAHRAKAKAAATAPARVYV